MPTANKTKNPLEVNHTPLTPDVPERLPTSYVDWVISHPTERELYPETYRLQKWLNAEKEKGLVDFKPFVTRAPLTQEEIKDGKLPIVIEEIAGEINRMIFPETALNVPLD